MSTVNKPSIPESFEHTKALISSLEPDEREQMDAILETVRIDENEDGILATQEEIHRRFFLAGIADLGDALIDALNADRKKTPLETKIDLRMRGIM